MRKPESPCLGCKHRTADCHAKCKCYKWYHAEQEMYKEFVGGQIADEGRANSYNKEKRDRLSLRERRTRKP